MLNNLLTALPPSPVWNAGHHLGLPEDLLKNLPHNKEGIVIASVGDTAKEAAKVVMEKELAKITWILITSNPPEYSWTRAFQSGFILEDKVLLPFSGTFDEFNILGLAQAATNQTKGDVKQFSNISSSFLEEIQHFESLLSRSVKRENIDTITCHPNTMV